MKIGILTQPLLNNYGCLLQAYALQTALRRMGHDPLVLDRHLSNPPFIKIVISRIKRSLMSYAAGDKAVELFPFRSSDVQKEAISRNTTEFIRKYIEKTEALFSTQALSAEAKKHRFEAYIVGSDQVWRTHFSPCITNYFLDFLLNDSSIKRISYAASFGLDYWYFDKKTTRQCKKLAQQFDAISVREDSGVDLCRTYLGVDAVHVVDPTLLLEPDDYRALVLAQNSPPSIGNLMTYILNPSDEKATMIKRVATKLGLSPFSVMPSKKLMRETQDQIEECVYPPVAQWLRGFMDAKFVIADSFHGCVFALLFNVPFIAVGNSTRGMARFESLLKLFRLTERLVLSLDDVTDDLMLRPINWDAVNKKRSELKVNAMDFLKNNLNAAPSSAEELR